MANSIKEYIAGTNADGSTYTIGPSFTYPTPDYLEGRGDTDIVVYVDDLLQSSDKYTVNGTALNFHISALPPQGARIQIKRTSSRDQRLTDYTDGALLNAETLDKDSDQLFYMAQEAIDTSNYVNIGSSQFYYSQGEPPENPKLGTLWYHLNNHANELKVWDGNEWSLATPVKETTRYTKDDFTEVAGDTDKLENVEFNSSTEVYLNGVKLIKGSIYSEVVTEGTADYWYDSEMYEMLWTKDLAADDILEVVTFTGGYATTVAEAEARINQLVNDAEGYAVASGNINLNINEDFAELVKFSSNPEDQSFQFQDNIHFSALHHAAKAAESSGLASGHAGAASGFALSASTHLANAEKYAVNPKDIEFTDSLGNTGYSALHYSEVAKGHAESIGGVLTTASGNQSAAENAQGKAEDAQGLAETAQGHAETAQGHAETAQGLSENAATLSAKYADHEGAFDVDGVDKFSAKHYADQVTQDISGITGVVDAADALADSLKSNINHPSNHLIDDGTGTAFYSARHYADQAAAFANQSVDTLIGWDLKDANTISTTTDGAPVFHSSTTLDINASEGVRANHVPLPIYGGVLQLQGDYLGFSGTTVTRNGNNFNVTFDVPFASASVYQVSATYSGNNRSTIRVVKTQQGFSVLATEVDSGAESISGEIVVTVYKFT